MDQRSLERSIVPRVAAAVAGGIGVAALWGWESGHLRLANALPGSPMSPTAAVMVLLLGTALWLAPTQSSVSLPGLAARACAVLAGALGVARLAGYLLSIDTGIDALVFPQRVVSAAAVGLPSRVSVQTALTAALVAVAFLLRERGTPRSRLAVEVLAMCAGAVALANVVGHVYGSVSLYGAMAFNTGVAVCMLVVGVLWSQADRGIHTVLFSDSLAGASTRRLFIAAAGILLALGWLRVFGERQGWFDSAYGTALFTVLRVILFAGLILWDGTKLLKAERAATEAARALRGYAGQLEAANEELNAFAYSVSHDLRTPLRAIDGFSQALLEDQADRLDEGGRHYLQRVRAATQRMGELIDDLLLLSRVTRSEMRRARVDLAALAADIVEDLRRSEPARHVDVTIVSPLLVDADPGLVRNVLENLLGNAWKFTSRSRAARIEVGVAADKGERTIFVRDNGAGFDMTYASKLFGAFQRLHAFADFPGSGIGLAIVQRIVRRHGGRVWAEGAVGRGATFYFTL